MVAGRDHQGTLSAPLRADKPSAVGVTLEPITDLWGSQRNVGKPGGVAKDKAVSNFCRACLLDGTGAMQ